MQSVLGVGEQISLPVDGSPNKYKHFYAIKPLGRGTYGSVFLVNSRNKESFALKIIKCPQIRDFEVAVREISTMIDLKSHNNIAKIFSYDLRECDGTRYAYILMEYCVGGSLNTRLQRYSSIGQNLTWMEQMADVLNYLDSKNVVHRDLKPDNMLITAGDNIKVADFGVAREYAAFLSGGPNSDGGIAQNYMASGAGSILWMAPEVFIHHYTNKADIFSLATLFYAIAEKTYVTNKEGKIYPSALIMSSGRGIGQEMYITGRQIYQTFSLHTPQIYKEIIENMFSFNPQDRPTAFAVLQRIRYAKMKFNNPV